LRTRAPSLASIGVVTLASFAPGCGGFDLPEEVEQTEHFRYYHRAGDQPCPELLTELELHRTATLEFLGLPEDDVGTID
jgi:hypothetical protein